MDNSTNPVPKKKKKHGFLIFVLCVVAIILLFKGAQFLCNKLAYNELVNSAIDYPFQFNNASDSMWYITDDFVVPTYYLNDKDKQVKVEWSSSNEEVISFNGENADVNRPSNSSRRVAVTQTHKKLLGKAEIQYILTVIPVNTLDISEVDVVTVDELREQAYNRDMQAVLDENGNLDYMLGEFKNTYVYSAEDALVVIEAYRNEFNAPENIEFVFKKSTSTGVTQSYVFDGYIGEYLIEGCSANVVVYSSDCRMTKIDINAVNTDNIPASTGNELNYEEIISNYLNTTDEYIVFVTDNIIYNDKFVQVVMCAFKNGSIYYAYIDENTGEVVKYFSDENTATYKMTECTSTDDFGNDFTFEAAYEDGLLVNRYILYDTERNIHAYDNEGYWEIVKLGQEYVDTSDGVGLIEFFVGLRTLGDKELAERMNFEISSDSTEFEKGSYAKAFYSMQKAYDWYKDNLGLISYDGKGAEILMMLDCGNTTDNAAWHSMDKYFTVNPVVNFKYSLGNNTDVLAHEYTHAVFSDMGSLTTECGYEVSGINEAYADIFGCLIEGNWIVGENYDTAGNPIYIRNIVDINVDESASMQSYGDKKYSEKYKDEYWQEEEHIISTVISHVAYKMYSSGYFTEDDVRDIWYTSLGYGYDDSSTFLTCRKYVIQAAQTLGYSTEQVDSIAYEFDMVEVFDPSYEITTQKFLAQEFLDELGLLEGEDSVDTIKTSDKAVEGDLILDDSTAREYIVVYSITAMMFGNGEGGAFIFEAGNDASEEEMEMISQQLSDRFNELYGTINISGSKVMIMYKQVPEFAMDIVKKFCVDSDDYLRSITFESLGIEETQEEGENTEFIDSFMKYVFDFKVIESTPYDFYDGLGLIE